MTATKTISDLLRAIVLNPSEDTPRLMLADELDALAGTDAERARAELVRVQVELAKYGASREVKAHWLSTRQEMSTLALQDVNPQKEKLHRRETELLKAHSSAWRCPPCPRCSGRKLVEIAHATHKCKVCDGTGSAGPLSERVKQWDAVNSVEVWKHTVTYVRGFPVVRVPFAEMRAFPSDVWDWNAVWLAWAMRCVREEGATFSVEGRATHWHGKAHCWYDANRSHKSGATPEEAELPTLIFDRLKNNGGRLAEYDEPVLGLTDLDRAVTALVVDRAYPQEDAP